MEEEIHYMSIFYIVMYVEVVLKNWELKGYKVQIVLWCVLTKKILGINVNDIMGIQPRSIWRRKKNIKKHYQ
jgi:hypothetical protein